ncbi:cobyrinate a,c-diamide synthase [Bacillus sp. H-16]|uniref:cobyrinate a,c-diamide synthase n=1 Tax=Alteribacter salitolerans TaxID=2912333 RepID=UPI00196358A3|nr:cobyrinate a,c-diamide synthase [Alteribacter salitolerans]MBM7094467.1 cobyrinate a,c-diamide synthase [Alteribacter salitolerans]
MSLKRLVIAGTESGVGKTTVTIGLMAAFIKRGYKVQGFKCGPDFIDPSFHTAVTGRASRNLDSWMLTDETIKETLSRESRSSDISIIEGVMGMFDGVMPDSDKGSSAHIASITNSPVLLVVDCAAQARSAAAVVRGFQVFSSDTEIVGVVANRVGSEGHFRLIQSAVEKECGIPVVGYLTESMNVNLPERHLGLIPASEHHEMEVYSHTLGESINQTFDLDLIYRLAEASSLEVERECYQPEKRIKKATIAVAKDEAFHFYYEENIELLQQSGAECIYFSPLHDKEIPSCDGIYIGGGFPEEFAKQLSENKSMRVSIAEAVKNGIPAVAECGGFMYFCEELINIRNERYPMTGILKGSTRVHKMLQAIRYVELEGEEIRFLPEGSKVRGHEFRYSSYEGDKLPETPKHVLASYSHLHFGSCPELAENFVVQCSKYS